jgi:hypothetical protein
MSGHLRYSNERTDGFVCSMHCQACALHDGLRSLEVIASNLAVAAALCEAWQHGYEQAEADAKWEADPDMDPDDPPVRFDEWPNTDGKAAP